MIARAARRAVERLGAPDLGVLLGSGFDGLATALGCSSGLDATEVPGLPASGTDGHAGRLEAARRPGGRVWVFRGRVHLHEGFDPGEVAFGIAMLAAAGARGVLLTCAAGGIAAGLEPGNLLLVRDHINLTGTDPVRAIPAGERRTVFPDLQRIYDAGWAERIREAARRSGLDLREGVLAAVHGPCYETPAEVRMLGCLGADVVSMSTVPEAIAAAYHGLRVAAVCCVANRGAGLGRGRAIEHEGVLANVERAVAANAGFLGAVADAGLL